MVSTNTSQLRRRFFLPQLYKRDYPMKYRKVNKMFPKKLFSAYVCSITLHKYIKVLNITTQISVELEIH